MLLDNEQETGQSSEELFNLALNEVEQEEAVQQEQEEKTGEVKNTGEGEDQTEEAKNAKATNKKGEIAGEVKEGEGKAEEEISEADRKKNAFASISKKLSESKKEAQESKAAKEAAELKHQQFKERLAKARGITVEELDQSIEKLDSEESGMTAEARAEIAKSKAEANEAKAEITALKLEKGINELLNLGGTEETILEFLDKSEEKYGIDLKTNPNQAALINFWKAENADNLIQSGIQEALANKKHSVIVNNDNPGGPNNKTDEVSKLEKMMMQHVKDNN